jgi:hypothetical protein
MKFLFKYIVSFLILSTVTYQFNKMNQNQNFYALEFII